MKAKRLTLTLAIALSLIPVAYFVHHLNDSAFISDAVGAWFATTAGLILGIPIALWINNYQQARQEVREQKLRRREALERQLKILALMKEELKFNLAYLRRVSTNEEGKPKQRMVHVGSLKDVLWTTFSNREDTKWLTDLDLIGQITNAYYYIRATIYLEREYFRAVHFLPHEQDGAPTHQIILENYIIPNDESVVVAIEQALAGIEEAETHFQGTL